MKHIVYNIYSAITISFLCSNTLVAQQFPASTINPKIASVVNFQFQKVNPPQFNVNKLAEFEIREAIKLAGDETHPDFKSENLNTSFDVSDRYEQVSEKTKTINKTYTVDSKDKLSISNQYGTVLVKTWSRNEIKVDVEIKAFEASDDKAQDLLENVSISESRSADLISFETKFDRSNMKFFWSRSKNGKEERRGLQVNYTVYMPSKNPLDINNKYGSTSLPELSGPVNINSSYGSFTAQNLSNAANRVKVSYGSASIQEFSSGNLDVSYGSLKLNNADNLNANIRYSSAKITHLTNSGNIDISYTGGFKIDEVDKNVKNLIINSSYSGVTLGLADDADFNFDVTVSYAGFNFDDGKISISSKTPDENTKGWNPTKNYKGRVGKGSDSRILIKSNYGGVRFL
ncbi:DUF4097 family beta strand repeat-containing protein [Daejeonella oryzae]|uniref:hypothetical protein n=1 Tax=Daejeonella oryzae TaxID=1122943 RepID=UPI00047EDBB1|nr:hypothetical protein [Daejeonella oryzae]